MKSHLAALCFLSLGLVILLLPAHAESPVATEIVEGKLVPGSISPDGNICMLEVFHNATTINSVILATSDRKIDLGEISILTAYSTGSPHKGRTTVLWNPDNRRVAVHDSLAKNSELLIYRSEGGTFSRLKTHDLLKSACGHFGISRSSVASSSQYPIAWVKDDILNVEVSVKLKSGKALRHTFPIHAPLAGESVQQ